MGANDAKRNEADDKRRRNETARKRRTTMGSAQGGADWGSADGALIGKAVEAVARDGGAIRLGYTRDGGAYAIGIYGDGEPFTEYVSPGGDIDEYLRGVIEDYGK